MMLLGLLRLMARELPAIISFFLPLFSFLCYLHSEADVIVPFFLFTDVLALSRVNTIGQPPCAPCPIRVPVPVPVPAPALATRWISQYHG